MDTDLHYVTYDPEALYQQMQQTYYTENGSVLYPGDEKEMLLRSVQAVLVQAFAGVDHALRMATLRYAVGGYLDLIGEKRGCFRLEEQAAEAEAEVSFRDSGKAKTIPAGTILTADGEHLYLLEEDLLQTGYSGKKQIKIRAEKAGTAGNGLIKGAQMQMLIPQDGITGISCTSSAAGGQDREPDETYRERIRTFGLANCTTGPRAMYEAAAKNVSSEILDVFAYNQGAGKVGISVLTGKNAETDTILEAVEKALNDQTVRPMTDQVTVLQSPAVPYQLKVIYSSTDDIQGAVANAVQSYQQWQDEGIGRPFNPDRLMAAIYQAGASRVQWGEESTFQDSTDISYHEIPPEDHCSGTIILEEAT